MCIPRDRRLLEEVRVFFAMRASCEAPPHPRSLSLEGRGEQDNKAKLVREDSHGPHNSFSPLPLRERGWG